jgi:hypothetical protein
MIVARQFIAWDVSKKGRPSRRDGVIKWERTFFLHWAVNTSSSGGQTVSTGKSPTSPSGTGRRLRAIQAMNCPATIISPPGTNKPSHIRAHFRHHITFEDEDEGDDEDD